MKISSKIDAVTIFARGAEIVRVAPIELSCGDVELIVEDLPVGLVANSLRVEALADGQLELGSVDTRSVHISCEKNRLDDEARQLIEKRIEKLEDEVQALEGKLHTAQTQKNLMEGLAQMPGSPPETQTDWGRILNLVGERLPKTHEMFNHLTIERRKLQKKIDDLRNQLACEPENTELQTRVRISARAESALKGQLILRYQVREASWEPLYDARLQTEGGSNEGPVIDLVRRASIYNNTNENWDQVALSLSTTNPASGTSTPDLLPLVLDILPDIEPMRIEQSRGLTADDIPLRAASLSPMMAGGSAVVKKAVERESEIETTGFAACFKVPGRICLQRRGEEKKVRLGSENLKPRLQVRATPLLDATAYLYADFKLEGELALLPGKVALYRDNIYVGDGQLPLVNVGERHELGFGADDQLVVKRVEKKRTKGSHGLIKTENTDEFSFRITIINHHKQTMPVRILERIPVSNHEKLKVERLRDMSAPTIEDVDDKRGVLAFEEDVAAGDEYVIKLHYRLSWPKDERIG